MGVFVLLLCARAADASAQPAHLPSYHITAALSLTAPHVRGTVDIAFDNDSGRPLQEVMLLLYANRFAAPDAQVDDFNRPFVYPRQEFSPGWMKLLEVRVNGVPTAADVRPQPGVPDGSVLSLRLPSPVPVGARATVTARFETFVPNRFGTFGEFEGTLTAVGGWYPSLAALQRDGSWEVDALPAIADFDVHLEAPPDLEVLLNGHDFGRATAPMHAAVQGVHYLSLIAAPDFRRDAVRVGATQIIYVHRPPRRASRISNEPEPADIMLASLQSIVEQRPVSVPDAPASGPLVVVEAPLRMQLVAPGEGMAIVSDRALKVVWVLRPFHEMQLAQAIYAELLRPTVSARESARDYAWVSEGLSYVLARRYLDGLRPGTRSVQDWIDAFNIFAIVDRFETAPKIPFVSSFFERARTADELHEQMSTFNNDLPPGHVVLGKLRQLIGDQPFAAVIDRCAAAPIPFRECAARASGQDLTWFLAQWLQPYPEINYDFAAVQLNSQRRDDGFESDVTVRRRASRPVREPVDVRLRSLGGQDVDLRWDGSGDEAHLTAVTPRRVWQAVIDPERRLIETTRADNASPPSPQIVLDTAEVEITSTEFGFSGLVVGRGRYDYRKDLAAAGFYTNRSVGVDAGARYHWGAQNDPNSYRHNVFAFYDAEALDRSFKSEQAPSVRTAGHVNGLGVRYVYNNIFAYDNPSREVEARLFADWFDRALGSNYNFVNWGGSLVLTHPLWTERTILAGQVVDGFSEPLGSGVVPIQNLFSLGGERSIRGIGAEKELGRNIFLLRGELRQAIYPEVDLNLLDVLVLRRAQLRLFVDTGQVSNSAGAVYDPAGYAVGVGAGFAAVYDFLGFFPSVVYLELATRVDRASEAGDVQVLFGTRQSF